MISRSTQPLLRENASAAEQAIILKQKSIVDFKSSS